MSTAKNLKVGDSIPSPRHGERARDVVTKTTPLADGRIWIEFERVGCSAEYSNGGWGMVAEPDDAI